MQGSPNNKLLLRNVRVVGQQRIIDSASLLIQDGLIQQILYSETSPSEATVDLEGLTLFSGFIDVHIHGAVGVDTMEATAGSLRKVSDFLAKQGVTAWLPTLVPAPQADYESAVRAIDELIAEQTEAPGGARVLGVHYEGPFVNTAQCGALRSEHFRSFLSLSDVDDLPVPEDKNAVRMMTLAPEIEGGVELVRELNSRGWVTSIGHTRAELEVLNRAFEAGARHLTHFMNAMPSLHHRSPGPVGWGLSRDDVTCDIIADGIHLDVAMLQLLLKLRTSGRLTLISDSIAAAGQGDGEYEIWGETISVCNGRTRNARGSIAGSVITMLDAVRIMRSVGASEMDVARMSATNPARLLRIDDRCGSVEEGKRADLVALDDSGNVQLTLVSGEVVFDRQA
ncbi:MAG TPA: N-acetylglucosamine-6-phosphate deacetylase [Pyrinomonadaceae bacterium]|nr:N-acetylglucosamine-6-phosphate deacetylase [Pyrinomonadaceae bacterium]